MLLDLLSQYLGDVATDVRELEDAKVERYEEEILAANRVNLRIRIRFLSGYLLELNEAAIVEAGHIRHLAIAIIFRIVKTILSFDTTIPRIFQKLTAFPIISILRIT